MDQGLCAWDAPRPAFQACREAHASHQPGLCAELRGSPALGRPLPGLLQSVVQCVGATDGRLRHSPGVQKPEAKVSGEQFPLSPAPQLRDGASSLCPHVAPSVCLSSSLFIRTPVMSKQGCLVTSFNLLPLQKLYLQMPSVTFGGPWMEKGLHTQPDRLGAGCLVGPQTQRPRVTTQGGLSIQIPN